MKSHGGGMALAFTSGGVSIDKFMVLSIPMAKKALAISYTLLEDWETWLNVRVSDSHC